MWGRRFAWVLRVWWLVSIPLAALLSLAGGKIEHAAILIAVGVALAAVLAPRARYILTHLAACFLLAACVSLLLHLLGDAFSYRYVWLYSAVDLPWYLKAAILWGGEEGTLLLLATLMAFAATRLVRYRGWAGAGALLLTAVFALGAALWNPFSATPVEDLLRVQSQGMNAHLVRIWMAFHPPLIFIAYTWVLAPAGAALEALATGEGDWPQIAGRYSRSAWLILSAGLATGMWWAYEDFTFGQFWHWDPVQTSVFAVWALVTAQVHGLRLYQPNRYFARTQPLLALIAAIAVLLSMMVTRNETLASSHRYIGDTSFPVLLAVAGILGIATALAWWRSRQRVIRRPSQIEPVLMLRIAIWTFSLMAAVAGIHLAQAYVSAALGVPRPESLKPFFETLARWTNPEELAELRRVFAQWDVDNFAMNRWLAPVGLVVGLIGGHSFLMLRHRPLGWAITCGVAAIAVLTGLLLHPFGILYRGTGVTSHHTVDILFWLDAMLVGAVYLLISALVWSLRMARRFGRRAFTRHFGPIGLIHVSVMVALMGALSASVLDSYAQKMLHYPADFGTLQRFPDGFSLRVEVNGQELTGENSDHSEYDGAFRAVSRVDLHLERDGERAWVGSGNTVFRDGRAPMAGGRGPVRQLCEILDYRYARHAAGPTYMLDPFIHRGLWRDVQVWVPPVASKTIGSPPQDGARRQTRVAVVVKTYPLMTWLWIGLAGTILGAGMLTFFAWYPKMRQRESCRFRGREVRG